MPIYGQSPWADASEAIGGVGNSMARVMLAQREGALRRQQLLQQFAMQQAQLRIEQQRQQEAGQVSAEKLEEMKHGHELAASVGRMRGVLGSPNLDQILSNPQIASALGNDLVQTGVAAPQQMNFAAQRPIAMDDDTVRQSLVAAIRAKLSEVGAGEASTAVKMMEPIQAKPSTTLLDPLTLQTLMQTPPAPITPYQNAELTNRQSAGDLAQQRLADQQRRTQALIAKLIASPAFQMSDEAKSFLDEDDSESDNSQSEVMFARNPKTGARIKSNDGGETWQPAQ